MIHDAIIFKVFYTYLFSFEVVRFILIDLKGCVRYIFPNLFFNSKRKHFWNLETLFLIHLKSSFWSWEN